MEHFICKTCGTQFPAMAVRPPTAPFATTNGSMLAGKGSSGDSLAELQMDHHNKIEDEEPSLTGIGTTPGFAIGQRALLVQTPQGNLLWDCITLLDESTKAAVTRLGGIVAIAISHPHYYSSMIEWAHAFDAPIYLHAADQQWVMRPDQAIQFWEGETKALWDGLTLIRGGGHFAGGTLLHWPAGADGAGALLTGDIIQVVPDRRWVSFMYSYPELDSAAR